jgi:phage terminase large subunit-like protein
VATGRRTSTPSTDLRLSPEVEWYLQDRKIPLPDCPPTIKTPEPRTTKGARFDPERVDKVLTAFKALHHVAGKWAGKPFIPDSWEIAYILAPVFGWVRWDDEADDWVRVIRDLYVDVPRKNGKSLLCAAIAIYMCCADGEAGAQVVTAATTQDQAKFVFTPIKTLAERSPALRDRVTPYQTKIVHPRSGSYIEVISAVADAQHGANIHCCIIDELHVHKSPTLVETLETGRGSRTQPLSVIITTADSGRPNTIYDRKRDYVERLARRTIRDENVFGVVWCAARDDDPYAEATWKKANPGYGVSPSRAYLAAESKKASNSPADLAQFLRLHLGIRTRQHTRYITMDTWDANASMVDSLRLLDRPCYGGLDLASVSDMTALCWLFPDRDVEHPGFDAVWRFWVPEAAMEKLDDRTAGNASQWIRDGWLRTTPGNVTDYQRVRADINADATGFDVQSIAFDRWNASQLSIDLMGDGFRMVQVGQGFASMSSPLKEVQRLLLAGSPERPLLRHGGSPVMRWMTDNLAVQTDAAGNVKPDRANARDKIDGWSALLDAMSSALTTEPRQVSAYADHDLRVL